MRHDPLDVLNMKSGIKAYELMVLLLSLFCTFSAQGRINRITKMTSPSMGRLYGQYGQCEGNKRLDKEPTHL